MDYYNFFAAMSGAPVYAPTVSYDGYGSYSIEYAQPSSFNYGGSYYGSSGPSSSHQESAPTRPRIGGWQPIDEATTGHRPGVYEYGHLDRRNGCHQTMYIGRTNDFQRRHNEHLNGNQQAVDQAIGNHSRRGDLAVRFLPTDNPAAAEADRMAKHVKQHGDLPKYNQRQEYPK